MATRKHPKLTPFEEALLFELRAIRLAIVDHSANTGKWLATVAKAAATPADNSAEIQRLVDQYTADLNASTDAVEEEVNQQTKER